MKLTQLFACDRVSCDVPLALNRIIYKSFVLRAAHSRVLRHLDRAVVAQLAAPLVGVAKRLGCQRVHSPTIPLRALHAALADAAITAAEHLRTLVSLDARARFGDLPGVTSLDPVSDHAV